jgi:hypothetical protein
MSSKSYPDRVVWDYFFSLRRIEESSRIAPSRELEKHNAALTIIMAVTAVEVFFNLWFRVLVEENNVAKDRQSLIDDLSNRRTINHKLKKWPERYLGNILDLTTGPGKAFSDIKELRNSIVHFTTEHETIHLGKLKLQGFADTTKYDDLTAAQAKIAVKSAEELVQEIFRLAKYDSEVQ